MNQDKMHIVNKIFNNDTIRTVWNKEDEKYYISVVDIVGILSDSTNPQIYWRVMKKRLKDEGNETVTNCNALKLKASDGKYRLTDAVDIEGMFRIIESIPSKRINNTIEEQEVIKINIKNKSTILPDYTKKIKQLLDLKKPKKELIDALIDKIVIDENKNLIRNPYGRTGKKNI